MINYIKVDPDGRITHSGSTARTLTEDEFLQHVPGVILVPELPPSINDSFWDGAKVVAKPVRPTKDHEFDYATKAWVDPRTPTTQWAVVRAERDARIAKTDWTQLDDTPAVAKGKWKTYRQALRDVTNQANPFAIVWPVPPA